MNSSANTSNHDPGAVKSEVRSGLNEAIAAGQVIIPQIGNIAKAPLPEFEDLALLRRFLRDPNAEFKSVAQASALSTILRGIQSALIVLPTGSGKSMLYLIAALRIFENSMKSSFVVVFVPFSALITDLLERAKRCRVPATKLDLSGANSGGDLLEDIKTPLVIISADQGYYENVLDFLRMAKEAGRLEMLVIDEAHLLLSPFRSKLKYLEVLDEFDVPLYLNTGTLTLAEEVDLANMFPASNLLTIRDSTTRPNISYRIQASSKRQFQDDFKELLSQQLSLHDGLGVVFCRSVEEVDSMAKAYRAARYHASLPSHQRVENVQSFTAGITRVMFATTAFGVGVDISNIDFCIHVGSPYSLTNYTQESGRIGRNGQISTATIIYMTDDPFSSGESLMGKDKIFEFMRLRSQCLRGFISREFDRESSCCFSLKGSNRCQNCMEQTQESGEIDNTSKLAFLSKKHAREEEEEADPRPPTRQKVIAQPVSVLLRSSSTMPFYYRPHRSTSSSGTTIQPSPTSSTSGAAAVNTHQLQSARRELVLASRQLTKAESLEVWRKVRQELTSLTGLCLWCIRDGNEVRHTSYECLIRRKAWQQEFRTWRSNVRHVCDYKSEKPARICISCGLPEVNYHRYVRKQGEKFTCNHDDSTWAVIFMILRDDSLRDELGQIHNEVLWDMDSVKLRDWLFMDIRGSGDSGSVKIFHWWFSVKCQRNLD